VPTTANVSGVAVGAGKNVRCFVIRSRPESGEVAEAFAEFAHKRESSFTGRWAEPRSERKDA
jgi:hypothetical protein